jgi:hypothetical protein
MNRTIITAVGLALALALPALPAQAENTRSFVSGAGSDSNPCTTGAPCRSFAQAITVTAPGGEIDVLDPAGYGAVTIHHAISIQGHGFAGVSTTSGTGITISAGTSDAVNLNGLLIEGEGTGGVGIQFNTGQSLTIDSCVIRNFTGDGIDFNPNAGGNLLVSNTLVDDNGASGVDVAPSGILTVTAAFNHVEANNNALYGITATGANTKGAVDVTVSESVASGNARTVNGGGGFAVGTETNQGAATMTVFHSVAANNGIAGGNGAGLYATGPGAAVLRVAQSVVTGNEDGWLIFFNGAVNSYGDNYIDGNFGANSAPPSGGLTKK